VLPPFSAPVASSLLWSRFLPHQHDTARKIIPFLLQSRYYSNDKSGHGLGLNQNGKTQEVPDLDKRRDGAQSVTKDSVSHANAKSGGPESESITASVSKYLHFPKIPHRPTKEELLAAATGFWSRLKVRFKWASIRSMRPWNADEWGAFVSWFMLGHIVWVLVGTTTFFSLLIFSINTVFAQGTSSDDTSPA
jgi:hypothetical protein